MNKTIPLKKMVDHPYFGLVCFVALCFVLPRYGAVAMMIGCAMVMSACVTANPGSFRSRSGALSAAVSLVVAMWATAAVLAWMSFAGWLTK